LEKKQREEKERMEAELRRQEEEKLVQLKYLPFTTAAKSLTYGH